MIKDELINQCEKELQPIYKKIEEISLFNTEKVLKAFKKNNVALMHFNGTTGYGYGDIGKETLNNVIADIFNAEKAVCSPNIVSGTHALSLCLFGVLRPYDMVLSVTGEPYDTLNEVIKGKDGSLETYNITWENLSLKNDKIDTDTVLKKVKNNHYSMIYLQRSRGYQWRNALSISEIEEFVKSLKEIGYNGCIMLDNCYGEFVDKKEPTSVGVSLVAGSMIKNIGGGLAPTGGYFAGEKKYVDKVIDRMTSPSIGGEVGSYAFGYQYFYQGLFFAPHVVMQALKGSMLFGAVLEKLGYKTSPSISEMPCDIIRAIEFNDETKLIKFIQNIQDNSPIDSNVKLYPWDMPGYKDKIIMAAGCFVSGSSIELSADAPIKPPYIAYMQGGLFYEHCKIALKNLDL